MKKKGNSEMNKCSKLMENSKAAQDLMVVADKNQDLQVIVHASLRNSGKIKLNKNRSAFRN